MLYILVNLWNSKFFYAWDMFEILDEYDEPKQNTQLNKIMLSIRSRPKQITSIILQVQTNILKRGVL